MKVKHCIALVLAGSLAGMALTYWYVTNRGSAVKSLPSREVQTAVSSLITTAHPVMRVFTLRVPWIGTVEPQASVELIALVAGRVEAVEAEDQTRIEKGVLVARLGGARIEGRRAGLAAEAESLKTRLVFARKTVERLKQSLKARLVTKDQVAAARDVQVKLETRLREARLNLDTFDKNVGIFAPMSGIFTNRRISVGQDVHAGQVLGEIIDTPRLRIAASIFPPQGIDLQGMKAEIRLDDDCILTGLVRRVLPRAGGTGAVLVWIKGPQIDRQLRPGQTVGGSMVVEGGPETLAVPESAIVYDSEERPCVFIRKNGAYRSRTVQLGLAQDGWVGIRSGLEQNQSVVTQGAYELFYRRFNEQFKVRD